MNTRAVRSLSQTYAQLSSPALLAELSERVRRTPRCAVSRYLLACQCFDRGRSAEAVRHMMVAHHAEPAFESAALLVFAGMNWIGGGGDAPFMEVVLETWEEFRRPEFDRTARERAFLDVFMDDDSGVNHISPLARRLWRLPIRMLRAQISQAVMTRDAARYPLLLAGS